MTPAQILAFEHETAGWPEGRKTDQIRRRYGISPARYARSLNAVLDSRAGLEADPVEWYRLRRLREQRQADRGARQLPE